MSEQTSTITPVDAVERHDAVVDFVAAVRRHLADLPVAEQEELTEGLEADLVEQVADGGAAALGDPAAYAHELRVAAGLQPAGSGRRGRRSLTGLLDGMHDGWDRRLHRMPGDVGGFLTALRPAWWLLRAWTAVSLGLVLIGHGREIAIVPAPRGNAVVGLVILALATIVSVQVGRGRLWPRTRHDRHGSPATPTRLVLLVLNLLAVLALPVLVGGAQVTRAQVEQYPSDDGGGADLGVQPGLNQDGHEVTNVYPYDAKGRPLVGVQLLDQDGRRVSVYDAQGVLTPWRDGDDERYNVFPLPSRILVDGYTVRGDPKIRTPYDTVPPVSLDGFTASTLERAGRSTTR